MELDGSTHTVGRAYEKKEGKRERIDCMVISMLIHKMVQLYIYTLTVTLLLNNYASYVCQFNN